MSNENATIDLTVPFLIWLVIWSAIALAFQSWAAFWIGLAPIVMWIGIIAVFMFFGVAMMFVGYMGGRRIKHTNRHGEVKYYQRRR